MGGCFSQEEHRLQSRPDCPRLNFPPRPPPTACRDPYAATLARRQPPASSGLEVAAQGAALPTGRAAPWPNVRRRARENASAALLNLVGAQVFFLPDDCVSFRQPSVPL
uniref:Uncharacterized protein n=1 Tax=Zea mays TaxID=4577 RepID=A0A804PU96_MAIZE